ncbi:hypothetical protein JTY60_01370 [symbiont of Argiope bruennichi]|uniref:tRNA ligase subunit PheS family protein n=1 Tax=symbiont of Argiope bruennichi TaxID=2810479 RepID=UPI003DA5D52C
MANNLLKELKIFALEQKILQDILDFFSEFEKKIKKIDNLTFLMEFERNFFSFLKKINLDNKKVTAFLKKYFFSLISEKKLAISKKNLLDLDLLIKNKIKDPYFFNLFKNRGMLHIFTTELEHIFHFFHQFNFEFLQGYEIDDKKYNFTYLNVPDYHPSTLSNDTFYLNNQYLLRSHCTNLSFRALKEKKNKKAEHKIFSFGKVYRNDKNDLTHSHQFFQIDVCWGAKDISVGTLKWFLTKFLKYYFENENLEIKFRSSYFPFTEPSFEVDLLCFNCQGKGCNVCNNSGYIELLGSGIFADNVLKYAKFNPKNYYILAFGIGLERLIMVKYGIKNIHQFYYDYQKRIH